MTLGDLHQAIQAAMGWDGDHLHAFDIAGREYGAPGGVDDVADEERLTLNEVLNSQGHSVLIMRCRARAACRG
jgi:hypothetical protein